MIKKRRSLSHREDLQNEMESSFMAAPNVSLSKSYQPVLQTRGYRFLRESDEAIYNLSSEADLNFFLLYEAEQQSQYVEEIRTIDNEIETRETVLNPFSVTDLDFSWLTDAVEQLQEVYQEVTEACTLDDEIDAVPSSAYYDASWLLTLLDASNVSMPDIGWLIDGGIGFEWRSTDGKGIGTMSIYGDNKVIYGASLGNGQKDKGTCELTDFIGLTRFFSILKTLRSQ